MDHVLHDSPPFAATVVFSFVDLFACLCILHQSCLTITAGTNCPILGDRVPICTSFGGRWGL